ncbi:MAG: NifB/NifX family molybdenum-iron cluster-binding protein [Bacteroidota bacterium]
MEIKFAFAVDGNNEFQKNHFGDTVKFLIYGVELGNLKLLSEEMNIFRNMDETKEHGSRKKGLAIIDFLKNNGVNVLVSRQFGKNIKMINEHFIPIIIYSEQVEEVVNTLTHQLHWIVDELESTPENYKLFTIK